MTLNNEDSRGIRSVTGSLFLLTVFSCPMVWFSVKDIAVFTACTGEFPSLNSASATES